MCLGRRRGKGLLCLIAADEPVGSRQNGSGPAFGGGCDATCAAQGVLSPRLSASGDVRPLDGLRPPGSGLGTGCYGATEVEAPAAAPV